MFRPSRDRPDRSDPYLLWKVRLFVTGAALALVGMALVMRWLVWAGIGILVVALLLRFLPARD